MLFRRARLNRKNCVNSSRPPARRLRSYNEQPWRFVVARREDSEGFGRLLDTLVDQNRKWARNAPVLALSVAKADFTHSGRPNRHAWYDVGQAAAYLTLQATELGLYVHQMAGFDPVKARQLLNIPEGYEPAATWPWATRTTPSRSRKRYRNTRAKLATAPAPPIWMAKPISQ